MELVTDLGNTPLTIFIPVVLSIVAIICVYTFGFKSAEEPAFDKLSVIDDRKPAGKKRKIKEKVNIFEYMY